AALGSVSGDMQTIARHQTWIESARKRIRQAIRATGSKASGILSAVLLGDRSRVGATENDVFSATGTAHLLAISGMHVGMAAAWLFAVCWWLLTRREAWMVQWPVRSLSLLAGLLSALTYASLAGWPLPAIRSGCMLAAGVLAWLLAEKASPLNTLLAVLMLMLIVDPSAIASLSLWLSFLATAGILLWAGQQQRGASGRLIQAVKGLFWVSLLAMLATLPVIVSVFGRVPVYGLPSNLLMVPLYGLFVMPLSLAGELMAVLGLEHAARGLLQWAGLGVGWGLDLITAIAEFPLGRLWAVHPGWPANGFYALLAALVTRQWLKGASRIRIAGLMAVGVGV
ncbi:MAG: ComEC/Rec2 family competence protein, partial [Mariprofundaceae bacterium]